MGCSRNATFYPHIRQYPDMPDTLVRGDILANPLYGLYEILSDIFKGRLHFPM